MPRLFAFLVVSLLALSARAQETSLEELVLERALLDYGAELSQGSNLQMESVFPAVGHPAMIAEFWMDPRSGRFLANVVPQHGAVRRVQGRLRMVVPVPVPVRQVMPGEILTASDLKIAELPLGSINSFAQRDPHALVGMEVRRILTPERPIMTQSVMKPLAVSRGAKVTIAFWQGSMRLSAPGRALADAHLGDEIRVVNLSSNKTITAVARENGIMEVLN